MCDHLSDLLLLYAANDPATALPSPQALPQPVLPGINPELHALPLHPTQLLNIQNLRSSSNPRTLQSRYHFREV